MPSLHLFKICRKLNAQFAAVTDLVVDEIEKRGGDGDLLERLSERIENGNSLDPALNDWHRQMAVAVIPLFVEPNRSEPKPQPEPEPAEPETQDDGDPGEV